MLKLKHFLNEVRVINVTNPKELPLKDNETIRVYHGFYNTMDAITMAIHGMSGKEKADRVYSPEAINNPKGLFVSVNFKVARIFSSSGVVIELNCKVSDLEAPVWHGGRGFFVQGDYVTGFENPDQREEQRLKNREMFKQDTDPKISMSDRPELAASIFGSEFQALFVGDLNKNMMKSFWFNENRYQGISGGSWHRMDRITFLKKYGVPYLEKRKAEVGSGMDVYLDRFKDLNQKILQPNDDFDLNKVIELLNQRYQGSNNLNMEELLNTQIRRAKEGNRDAVLMLRQLFWPKQLQQLGIPNA